MFGGDDFQGEGDMDMMDIKPNMRKGETQVKLKIFIYLHLFVQFLISTSMKAICQVTTYICMYTFALCIIFIIDTLISN